MTDKTVFVSHAQKAAARVMIQRSQATGRSVPAAVRKIADAPLASADAHPAPEGRHRATPA